MPKGRGAAAVQVGGHQHQAAFQLAEVVAATGLAQHLAQLGLDRRMAEQAGGQGAAQAFGGGQPGAAAEQGLPGHLQRQARQCRAAARELRPGRPHEGGGECGRRPAPRLR
jgi:hypothetical protein